MTERYRPQEVINAQEWNNFWGAWRPKLEEQWGEEKTAQYITNMGRFKASTIIPQTEFLGMLEDSFLKPLVGDES